MIWNWSAVSRIKDTKLRMCRLIVSLPLGVASSCKPTILKALITLENIRMASELELREFRVLLRGKDFPSFERFFKLFQQYFSLERFSRTIFFQWSSSRHCTRYYDFSTFYGSESVLMDKFSIYYKYVCACGKQTLDSKLQGVQEKLLSLERH